MIHSTSPSNKPIVPTPDNTVRRSSPSAPPPGADSINTANSNQIRSSLDNIPEIRTEVVNRARALAADPAYPPREIIDAIVRELVAET